MSLPAKLARKKLSVLLGGERQADSYIKEFGTVINPQQIEKFKNSIPKKLLERPNEESNPYYAINVTCPICGLSDIPCYELKAKTQIVELDSFLVPHYKGLREYPSVDYNNMAVTVCPKCLFASPDKKDFITQSVIAQTQSPSQLPLAVIDELKRTQAVRRSMIGAVNAEEYFQVPRTRDAAILTYKLALHRAMNEAKFETNYSYYKGGAYALKIADIQNQTGSDTSKAYTEAVKMFSKSYSTTNAPDPEVEFRVVYLILACYLKINMPKSAGEYLAVFDKLQGELKSLEEGGKKVNRTALSKWHDKARSLWELRDDPKIWETPIR